MSICPRISAGWTPLHHCAARGEDGAIEALLRAGAEAAAVDAAAATPLHLAAERGHAMTAFLLASRAPAACRVRDAGSATPPDLAHDLKHGEVGGCHRARSLPDEGIASSSAPSSKCSPKLERHVRRVSYLVPSQAVQAWVLSGQENK